ncbi:hypothetical protein BRADI_4g31816v3 [Brachypodium distachyon]|uniref:Uncharacterized protein n=1 Tax=Brachypodium distachyon TaxID=15368 RepID=A0A2K2CRN7_BRADI|nr:hypothetical protein BRADI_4g31816v3 [Brachypodium distachyon]
MKTARRPWPWRSGSNSPASALHLYLSVVVVCERMDGEGESLTVPFSMEITTLICWSIWKTRNDFIFNKAQHSLYRCRRIFIEEMNLVFHRAKRKQYVLMGEWLKAFR